MSKAGFFTRHIHAVISALLIVLCLGLIWLADRTVVSMDVTANQRHSLNDATVAMLQAHDKPISILAVLGPDPQVREGVEALVSRFQQFKADISLEYLNPETQPEQARALNVAAGGELIVRSGEREQRLQTLSERSLAGAFLQLLRSGNRDIAFITGHQERSPVRSSNDDWQLIAERLARNGLISREVSLVSDPYLPDSIDLLVIADPRQAYFPGEIASIKDYMDRGGNLLWLIDSAAAMDASTRLDTLADDLGISLLPGTVIDTASQALAAGSPDFVVLDRFPTHPVTRNLSSPVLLPQATALAVTPMAGQTEMALLQTPAASWTETGALSGEVRFDENTTEIAGPLLLAVAIERTGAAGTQRFAVVGDADFAASQFVGNGANQSFTEALVLWLTGEGESIDFVTERAPDSELILSNRSGAFIFGVAVVGLPALLALTGVLVRWRRRRAV